MSSGTFFRRIGVAVAVLSFGTIGMVVLSPSHAATPSASIESETGTIGSPARIVQDSFASGGQALQFGGAYTMSEFLFPKRAAEPVYASNGSDGNIWVSESGNNTIAKVTPS